VVGSAGGRGISIRRLRRWGRCADVRRSYDRLGFGSLLGVRFRNDDSLGYYLMNRQSIGLGAFSLQGEVQHYWCLFGESAVMEFN
jgi:hypothetical protein